MRETIKLGVILLIITSVAAVVLGFTNDLTKGKIEEVEAAISEEARREVLPADKFEQLQLSVDDARILSVYKGLSSSGEVVGYAIATSTNGYSPNLEMITGISIEGKVTGIKVTKHQETPGLGANAENKEFTNKFIDKSIDEEIVVVKTAPQNPNEVQALTGATMTSNGVRDGVNLAIGLFNSELK
ncbi:RnfABCDGE type electron transport complex subunit G [Clostridiaceae bacterium M8S5]|nr:RnfABCDGE type electron transport complex subunit G [Clostridiaceae bacterium M8S5]